MRTKATMKDIAREAGVSVATVSYVLNNRTEARISDETRKKVLQIVNLLDYTPNQSAKALATSRSRNIAVYLDSDAMPLKRSEQLYFINLLSAFLYKNSYNLMHLCPHTVEKVDNADAIVCYDISEAEFRSLADQNFIPMLAFDCIVDDYLFFQVLSDYNKAVKMAKEYFAGKHYIFVSLEIVNIKLKSNLEAVFPNILYLRDMRQLETLANQNILLISDTLNRLLKDSCNVCYYPSITEEKINTLFECVELAIKRVPVPNHNIIV